MISDTRRVLVFLVFSALVAVAVVAYAVHSRMEMRQRVEASAAKVPTLSGEHASAVQLRPHLVFRNTALGPGYGCVSMVPLDDPAGARVITKLPCDRVYATAGSGMALQASRGVITSYKAAVFDRELNVTKTFKLAGVPSRTRLSRDGAYAASTVFVSGDSYNSAGFSTRTNIYDLRSGERVGDLEKFAAERNGRAYKKVDFNYWGVTFVPKSDEFYATLGTGGTFHLVKGSISQRRVRVISDEVECPSLSPDGTRIAYKWRTKKNGRLIWRLRVLNPATNQIVTVNEERSVDDQAEWLDEEHLVYALPKNVAGSGSSDIWIARADGRGDPALFVSDGSSPAVVRP